LVRQDLARESREMLDDHRGVTEGRRDRVLVDGHVRREFRGGQMEGRSGFLGVDRDGESDVGDGEEERAAEHSGRDVEDGPEGLAETGALGVEVGGKGVAGGSGGYAGALAGRSMTRKRKKARD
jgi:hypothetical protein